MPLASRLAALAAATETALLLAISPLPAHSASPSAPPGTSCGVPATGADSTAAFPIQSIALEGLRTTRKHVVMRELAHRPGDRFSCEEWQREKNRLEDLDIFSDIRIRIEPDSGRIVYAFRELPPYIPFVALSITEQDGLSLGPALASLNFLGRGIRAEFISRFGGTTELLAAVSSTWLAGLPVEYDLALIRIDSYNNFEDFHEESWRLKVDLNHRLQPKDGRSQLLYVGEMFWIRPDSVGAPFAGRPTLSPGADFIPRLGLGYLWDGRDRRNNPTKGVYQEVRLTRNGGWLGGDADYSEWLADTRIYLPWSARNVLYLGGLYQYRTGEIGRTFPVYDRFHAGGINTLRGYGNDAMQGRSEWIATLENRVDLIRKKTFKLWKWGGYYGLQGLVGVEGASLWDHDAPLESDFHTGAYLGLHVLVAGIDRIRLEAGSKVAKLEFQYDIGIMEKPDAQRFRAR